MTKAKSPTDKIRDNIEAAIKGVESLPANPYKRKMLTDLKSAKTSLAIFEASLTIADTAETIVLMDEKGNAQSLARWQADLLAMRRDSPEDFEYYVSQLRELVDAVGPKSLITSWLKQAGYLDMLNIGTQH